MKIIGNPVGTPTPRTNYEQTDPKKADYLKGKDVLDKKIEDAKKAGTDAQTATNNAKTAFDKHNEDKNNPHGVTADQVGATPASHATDKNNPHSVTAEQVGAVTEAKVTTMINNALGVIENGTY